MSTIYHETLPNGLELVVEPMVGVKSLAMTLLMPAGAAVEPENQLGISSVVSELMPRGAAGRSAREHSDALDLLGVQRSTDNSIYHTTIRASMLSAQAQAALPLLWDMAIAPNLDEESFEPARDLCLQSLASMMDEPQQRVGELIRHQHQPDPFGRSALGDAAHLQALTVEDVQTFTRSRFVPGGSILSLAGDIEPEQAKAMVESHLGNWQGEAGHWPKPSDAARGYQHVESDSAQMHIALAYNAPKEADENSILQKAATAVLSGGMSGRLFTEVREKRGLCYSVFAQYAGQRNRGTVIGYAGTTPERSQETLDVFIAELNRLGDGVEVGEFERAIVGMKSHLVMQGESTAARSSAIASDVFLIGRPRSLDELTQRVDHITLDDLNAYVSANPPGEITVVTLGPQALEL